ncbi:hypothetical protein EDC01DRAFT_756062 [Geopyxis carbonaria]|nr:hypothetical protein EDC01DRAFT_756062 [Geopyxis carbonaria]
MPLCTSWPFQCPAELSSRRSPASALFLSLSLSLSLFFHFFSPTLRLPTPNHSRNERSFHFPRQAGPDQHLILIHTFFLQIALMVQLNILLAVAGFVGVAVGQSSPAPTVRLTSINANVVGMKPEYKVPGLCRRYGQQTVVAGNRLFLFGGRQVIDKGNGRIVNETNEEMLVLDLDEEYTLGDRGSIPWERIPAKSTINPPAVKMGGLYTNANDTKLILFEGQVPPEQGEQSSSMWSFDIQSRMWTATDEWKWLSTNGRNFPFRKSRGAVVNVPGKDEGYFIGGLSAYENSTYKGWYYPDTEQFVELDTGRGTKLDNSTGLPIKQKRIGPSAVHIDSVGEQGIIVLLGGTEEHTVRLAAPPIGPPNKLDGLDPNDVRVNPMSQMDVIWIYDIAKRKWHFQTASGDSANRPFARKNFCSAAVSGEDGQSYIYVFGGGTDYRTPMLGMNDTAYNDMFVLTLPAFRWQRVNLGPDGQIPTRQAMTCHAVDSRLFIVGGTAVDATEKSCAYDELRIFDMTALRWITDYVRATPGPFVVPTAISDTVGNQREPAVGWDDLALQQLFTGKPTGEPALEQSPQGTSRRAMQATCAAGVLAGLLVLAIGTTIVCIQRRRRDIDEMNVQLEHLKYLFGYQEPHTHNDGRSLYISETSRKMDMFERVKFRLGLTRSRTGVIGGFYENETPIPVTHLPEKIP